MLRANALILVILLLFAGGAFGQSCADVNNSGGINVVDMVYMINSHLGGPPLPVGKGDIDTRLGYNTGDINYLADFIFRGGPLPNCNPGSPYTLMPSADSLILPTAIIPAGSGQKALPILLVNHQRVTFMVIPLKLSGLGPNIILDSARVTMSVDFPNGAYVSGSNVTFALGTVQTFIEPGIHLIGYLYLHYASSPGGTVTADTTTLPQQTFLNYTYGNFDGYGPTNVGIPTVVIASGSTYPNMSVVPDTLTFYTLAGYPNPDPQSFTVTSDGNPFNWNLTKTSWVNVSATAGVSGEPVQVTPDITGMGVGTHYGEVVVYSSGAVGSPQTVAVKLILNAQYPTLDANCDGKFNIADVVVQINYIFVPGSQLPCNPCTGQLLSR